MGSYQRYDYRGYQRTGLRISIKVEKICFYAFFVLYYGKKFVKIELSGIEELFHFNESEGDADEKENRNRLGDRVINIDHKCMQP